MFENGVILLIVWDILLFYEVMFYLCYLFEFDLNVCYILLWFLFLLIFSVYCKKELIFVFILNKNFSYKGDYGFVFVLYGIIYRINFFFIGWLRL